MERLSCVDEDDSRLRMRLSSNPLMGIIAASVAAGPLCILLFLLGTTAYLIHDHARSSFIVYVWREYPYSSLLRSTLFGFVASMVPNAIGSWTLGVLGTVLPIARLWAFWPIAGGGIALLVPPLLEGRSASYETYLYSAALGAVCAAICRFFTRWEPV